MKSTVVGTATITGTLDGSALAARPASPSCPARRPTSSSPAPGSATAGSATNVTVTAKDTYGNTATGYLGTVHFTSTDGSASLPGNYAFVSGDTGVNTFPVTLKTAGSQTVTAAPSRHDQRHDRRDRRQPRPGQRDRLDDDASPASVLADDSSTADGQRHAEGRLRQRRPGQDRHARRRRRQLLVDTAPDVTNGTGQASFAVKDATVENVVYNAIDTSDALPLTDTASVSFVAGPLASITLNPANATVAAGVAQTYTVRGFDAFGHDLGDVTGGHDPVINPDGTCTGDSCTATSQARTPWSRRTRPTASTRRRQA